ncbi:ABC transporter ATP-binding protein [Devosia yakushimensis]|uniref:ABC transporter ATP-binding protein n=1 Tax=Devosia yakushimensis TaxID=470028 RepID=A0ABQ5UI91_9HYPH|nr:sn-glycerol-3-phosphate ABC transporter ATP-binding protein UgpC [Devosia yakushimensis]GLQ11324.1 ABC transporter ATP-binding protein [Devosia yakushimensis]
MSSISLNGIAKSYGGDLKVIHDLSLDVRDGEFLVLVGPSGCGKSTLLRMIAGLEDISGGTLLIGDRKVNNVDPKDRDIAMVFQSYALYPHMSVYDNIAFPLRMAGLAREADARVREVAALLQLTPLLERKPANLSGGQRQRVAMGRAMVRKPAVFLMDEPLSNLDAKLRVQMRAEVTRLQKDQGVTTVYVTHDQVEAMTMGDRVAVLKGGHLQQVDTPQALYSRPANAFVATFIGSPAMNLFEANLTGTTLTLGSQSISLPDTVFNERPSLRGADARRLILGIRPESLEDAAFADPGAALLDAKVTQVEMLGSEAIVHLAMDAPMVDGGDPDALAEVGIQAAVGRFNPKTAARAGAPITLSADASAFHFFDPDTRNSIW